ncbi:VirB8/TrbF family protein, partial [Acinetobacter baumannii]
TVEHHVARVAMPTGIVDIQRCLDCQTSYNEVTDYYWLSLYVRTREGFTFPEFDSIYRTIGLLSSQPLTTDFYEYFRP